MSSILSSQGVVLATAMAAVSGTIILLAFRIQKSLLPPNHHHHHHHLDFSSVPHLPRSCISSSVVDEKIKDKKKKRKKVHFAEDVVDPIGNSEEYRKLRKQQQQQLYISKNEITDLSSKNKRRSRSGELEMPENRAALYNGILRDRVVHRVAYSC